MQKVVTTPHFVMKNGTFLSLILIATAAAGALAYDYTSADPVMFASTGSKDTPVKSAKKARPAKKSRAVAVKAVAWADCAALEKRLTEKILKRLPNADRDSIKNFLSKPANRLMLAQWQFAHCENAVDTSKHVPAGAGEVIPPRTMKELFATADPATRSFVERLTNNAEWMEQMVYSGECINPGRAVAILAALAASNKDMTSNPVLRNIATATALEWARFNWNFEGALGRADFYMRNHRKKRFHKGFRTLPFWQYRVIGGCKGDNANGSVASLEWALENVHLPVDQYTGACWYASYLGTNLFGDSVHGDHYYAPYDDVYGDNAVQRTFDVGGVCGSLSHFGAFAALGNGVPALAAGEPGHCAYIVCVDGKWTPAYSLSWERGLHWQVWNGNYKYSSLHMATELNSPEQAEATAFSNACRTLGEVFAAAGKTDKALKCFRLAVTEQPLNYLAWCAYAKFLSEHMVDDGEAWKHLYKALCKSLAPRYPEMAAELLLGHIHAGMHRACPSAADRKECYEAFWQSVDGMGPDRWAVENLCQAQANGLKAEGGSEEQTILDFYALALRHTVAKASYAPVILSWGNGAVANMSEATRKKLLEVTLTALSQDGVVDDDARDNMLAEALLGAERMRDRSSFQAIGKMLSDKYRQNRLPSWEPFPGKLMSQGGMIYTSSRAHDAAAEHWGVLEPTGGRFHTGNEVNPWVVVEMPKMARINGVVVISTSGQNVYRLRDMKVQYSETGRDDDWHEAGAFPAPSTREINRLDLQESRPRARFIRIMRGGAAEVFHLNGIFVYGEPAS